MPKTKRPQAPAPDVVPTLPLATLAFLQALAANNDRAWFEAHRQDWEAAARGPFLALIAALDAPLKALSPHYGANPKPVGGSMFRLHRDTRFSADKTPYKTWLAASFHHTATRAIVRAADGSGGAPGRLDAPGFYLHVKPGASFCGAGIWHPQPATLARIRAYLVNNPASWTAATRAPAFIRAFGGLTGEVAKRLPAGFDPAHPLIDDLRRKDFLCSMPLADAEITAPDLLDRLVAAYTTAAPMVDWLCGALDLDY